MVLRPFVGVIGRFYVLGAMAVEGSAPISHVFSARSALPVQSNEPMTRENPGTPAKIRQLRLSQSACRRLA